MRKFLLLTAFAIMTCFMFTGCLGKGKPMDDIRTPQDETKPISTEGKQDFILNNEIKVSTPKGYAADLWYIPNSTGESDATIAFTSIESMQNESEAIGKTIEIISDNEKSYELMAQDTSEEGIECGSFQAEFGKVYYRNVKEKNAEDSTPYYCAIMKTRKHCYEFRLMNEAETDEYAGISEEDINDFVEYIKSTEVL